MDLRTSGWWSVVSVRYSVFGFSWSWVYDPDQNLTEGLHLIQDKETFSQRCGSVTDFRQAGAGRGSPTPTKVDRRSI